MDPKKIYRVKYVPATGDGTKPEDRGGVPEGAEGTPATGVDQGTKPEGRGDEIQVPEGAKDPDAVRNAIRAEREAAKAARAEAEAAKREAEALREKLAQAESASKDEVEKLRGELAAARGELKLFKSLADRYAVALDKGLPKALADRLQGDTPEALAEDADQLLSLIPRSGGGDPDFDAGPRKPGPKPKKRPEEAHNDFLSALFSGSATGDDVE